MYREGGLLTSVWLVDTEWLYSFYWCVGVDLIHTSTCDVLSRMETPLWHMVCTFITDIATLVVNGHICILCKW